MALPTSIIWEVRVGSLGSGGWEDGGSGTDYSQQDNPQIDTDDWETKNLDYDRLYSSSEDANLVAALVGNTIKITAGTNFTVGTYHIDGSGSDGGGNYIDIDRNCASANSNDGAGVLGGAIGTMENLAAVQGRGHQSYIKSGTYILTANIDFPSSGNKLFSIKMYGYNSSRGDEPAGDDRPLIQAGEYSWTVRGWVWCYDLRMTTTHVNGWYFNGAYSKGHNIKSHNTSTGYAFNVVGDSITLVGCEGISDSGIGFYLVSDLTLLFCSAHDCGSHGIRLQGERLHIMYCEATHNGSCGIYSWGSLNRVIGCTISDNNSHGIWLRGKPYTFVNNQITYNGVGGSGYGIYFDDVLGADTAYTDYNNFYNNQDGISNRPLWPDLNNTANDPGYTDKTNRDYSSVDDANALVMSLGVS